MEKKVDTNFSGSLLTFKINLRNAKKIGQWVYKNMEYKLSFSGKKWLKWNIRI